MFGVLNKHFRPPRLGIWWYRHITYWAQCIVTICMVITIDINWHLMKIAVLCLSQLMMIFIDLQKKKISSCITSFWMFSDPLPICIVYENLVAYFDNEKFYLNNMRKRVNGCSWNFQDRPKSEQGKFYNILGNILGVSRMARLFHIPQCSGGLHSWNASCLLHNYIVSKYSIHVWCHKASSEVKILKRYQIVYV